MRTRKTDISQQSSDPGARDGGSDELRRAHERLSLALSATGLGSMKAKDAVGDLFVALDHKVPEAAVSIGLLCAGNECDKLAAKLGSVAFDVVTSGLEEVLFRPPADVS